MDKTSTSKCINSFKTIVFLLREKHQKNQSVLIREIMDAEICRQDFRFNVIFKEMESDFSPDELVRIKTFKETPSDIFMAHQWVRRNSTVLKQICSLGRFKFTAAYYFS